MNFPRRSCRRQARCGECGMLHGVRFRFSVFAISIPRLRTHAGVVASSRLVSRGLYSICFSSALHTAARPGPRPRQRVWSAVNMGSRATFKARLSWGNQDGKKLWVAMGPKTEKSNGDANKALSSNHGMISPMQMNCGVPQLLLVAKAHVWP